MEFLLPTEISMVLSTMDLHHHQAYVVGGCVRDMLLGNQPTDYDITTSALPQQSKELFAFYSIFDTGLQHGTITVIINQFPIEVTTFRKEKEYLDHRRPSGVLFCDDLKEDLERRDFTINAMAYHPLKGLVDYFNGQQDLVNRTIRCVGSPKKRFDEDALRLLRCLRFASTLGFAVDVATKKQVFEQKHLLSYIAMERIQCEFLKLLCGMDAVRVMIEYHKVLVVFLPELHIAAWNDEDVIKKLRAISELPRKPILRLAVLLSWIGVDITEVKNIGQSLKLSKMQRKELCFLTNGMLASIDTAYDLKQLLGQVDFELIRDLLLCKEAKLMASCESIQPTQQLRQFLLEIEEKKQPYRLSHLAINGNDVLDIKGYDIQREHIGRCLQTVLDLVMRGELNNTKEALLQHIVTLISSS